MKYSSISAALFGLYNWSRQSESKALDYQMAFGIKSTLPRELLCHRIAQSRIIIKKIEAMCNPKQLAVLEFRYGFKDKCNEPLCLVNIGKLACPDNAVIGELVAKKWRNDKEIIIHQVKEICQFQKSQAYEKIAECKERLELINLGFISDNEGLYCEIEKLLIKNHLLKL